jgi:hypothetical protein
MEIVQLPPIGTGFAVQLSDSVKSPGVFPASEIEVTARALLGSVFVRTTVCGGEVAPPLMLSGAKLIEFVDKLGLQGHVKRGSHACMMTVGEP